MQALQQTVGSVVLGVDKSGLDARFLHDVEALAQDAGLEGTFLD